MGTPNAQSEVVDPDHRVITRLHCIPVIHCSCHIMYLFHSTSVRPTLDLVNSLLMLILSDVCLCPTYK